MLEASRQQLANSSPDLAAEPTIATGVRAVVHLLASLNQFVFNSDPALAAKYGMTVPVVAVDGKVRFKGVVNPVLFDRLLVDERRGR